MLQIAMASPLLVILIAGIWDELNRRAHVDAVSEMAIDCAMACLEERNE